MTLEYIVASAHRLRQLRLIAEAPTLKQRVALQARRARRQVWQDVVVALGVLALGYLVGGLVS